MKKKTFKRLVAVMLVLIMTMGMWACGKTESNSDNGLENENQKDIEAEEYTLSSSFSTDSDSIWYYIKDDETLGKDATISKAFVFKDGEFKIYNFTSEKPYTLGDFAQMMDEEIIQKLEEYQLQEKEKVQARVDELKRYYDILLQSGMLDAPVYALREGDANTRISYDFTAIKADVENNRNELDSFIYPESEDTYQLAIYTDSTGNKTSTESIKYGGLVEVRHARDLINAINEERFDDKTWLDDYDINAEEENDLFYYFFSRLCDINESKGSDSNFYDMYTMGQFNVDMYSAYISDTIDEVVIVNGIDATRGSIQVYDSYYGGYFCEDGKLITRSENTVNFKLDDVGTEGIEVDPK